MDIPAFLSSVEVFSELGPDVILMLSRYVEVERYEAGEIILPQGVSGRSIWVIYQGSARVIQNDARNGKTLLASLAPKGIFGEISMISKSPTSAEIQAGESLTVFKIPHEVVSFVMESDLVTHAYFSRTFVERLSANLGKLGSKG